VIVALLPNDRRIGRLNFGELATPKVGLWEI
jgi:hypothetical protein